jgi:hypothetical protein
MRDYIARLFLIIIFFNGFYWPPQYRGLWLLPNVGKTSNTKIDYTLLLQHNFLMHLDTSCVKRQAESRYGCNVSLHSKHHTLQLDIVYDPLTSLS